MSTSAIRGTTDDALLQTMAHAARLNRLAQALLVEATAHVLDRSRGGDRESRLTTRAGCRSVAELVERVTRESRRNVGDLVAAARAVQQATAVTTGEILPADFPAMRSALSRGEVAAAGVVAVSAPLASCPAGRSAVLSADAELAASACGDGADQAPPASAEDLRAQAGVWAAFLDQDGAEPVEARAMRKRGLCLGPCRDGLVPVRGHLLPEVAAQLQRGFDSLLNPKADGDVSRGPRFEAPDGDEDRHGPVPAVADQRSRVQRQHDAFATLLTTAAASGALPTLGGAAPVLVVSVRERDLVAGRGAAHISGIDEPVPLSAARHVACAGAVQRVRCDDRGRVIGLSSPERIFTHHQRRAIGLRDGGCVIPSCHISAEWCEVHHVEDHSRGGPTHIDNGVLLCWFHHRSLDASGWAVRMSHGVPEVRGPAWWDASGRWRLVTKSPTRLRDRIAAVP